MNLNSSLSSFYNTSFLVFLWFLHFVFFPCCFMQCAPEVETLKDSVCHIKVICGPRLPKNFSRVNELVRLLWSLMNWQRYVISCPNRTGLRKVLFIYVYIYLFALRAVRTDMMLSLVAITQPIPCTSHAFFHLKLINNGIHYYY